MKIVAKTDVGKTRENNQDAYSAGELPDGVAWAVVCDGMDGAAGGNVASTSAVKVIAEQITASYRASMSSKSIKNMLVSAINAANISVYDLAQANKELRGMGTTVVCALVTGSAAYIANAGDSRAYMLSGGTLSQLTRDHSVVQEMVETGKITQSEAKVHPNKNIITRAIGMKEDVETDFFEYHLKKGDVILMCTDGLSNMVEDEDIFAIIKSARDIVEAGQMLIERANANGGRDNIGVVLAQPFSDEVSIW